MGLRNRGSTWQTDFSEKRRVNDSRLNRQESPSEVQVPRQTPEVYVGTDNKTT